MSIFALMKHSIVILIFVMFTTSCASTFQVEQDWSDSPVAPDSEVLPKEDSLRYLIGPGDTLKVFVWRNAELSTTVPVRPDGRISLPLVDDIVASDLTPSQLAKAIKKELAKYIREPNISVIVTGFGGSYNQQVRVVGEVLRPQAIPYRQNMTVLDAMILAGGLTEFAAGNRAVIIRKTETGAKKVRVKLKNLLKKGDIRGNYQLLPGDVLLVPETLF